MPLVQVKKGGKQKVIVQGDEEEDEDDDDEEEEIGTKEKATAKTKVAKKVSKPKGE